MKIHTVVVGQYEVNCYLYWNEQSSEGVIIDPGAEEKEIFNAVEEAGFTPKAILLTHGHGDHIGAVIPVKEKYKIPLYAGTDEKDLLKDSTANMSAFIGKGVTTPPADVWLNDEDFVTVGSINLRALHTPGHSPGGVCYLDEKENILFCGDTLFYGSIGRTDFPGCSLVQLLNSIKEKILTLPSEIKCYPGHGPATTVGAEKINNPFLQGGTFV